MGFPDIMVGGTKGVTSKMKHSEIMTSYANENFFTTQRTFQQKPQQDDTINNKEQQ